ncbi:hypothetical protein TP70_07650 [Staphylococcus microti]|uniref:Uncharacterized protein n=1 Tax=Staphylococcus microti TaxID=569857 RepID=A0ABR5C6S5_9STAP|nr:hypothetical protein TP70_07650 [Staphylococcus microti]PNZ84701.1 hypothetical protein CD132_00085 [Staphylococcus microti]
MMIHLSSILAGISVFISVLSSSLIVKNSNLSIAWKIVVSSVLTVVLFLTINGILSFIFLD